MSHQVPQSIETRRKATALMAWLCEASPDDTAADLIEVVLGDLLLRLGVDLTGIPSRGVAGRPSMADPIEQAGRACLTMVGGRRVQFLLHKACRAMPTLSRSQVWAGAVMACYVSVTDPQSPRCLGPVSPGQRPVQPSGPYEAAA